MDVEGRGMKQIVQVEDIAMPKILCYHIGVVSHCQISSMRAIPRWWKVYVHAKNNEWSQCCRAMPGTVHNEGHAT
ncbi:hypothetical protein HAX54_047760, partial [Datura stramonium]|nr:hypothetical protein [Datura stramonium]